MYRVLFVHILYSRQQLKKRHTTEEASPDRQPRKGCFAKRPTIRRATTSLDVSERVGKAVQTNSESN
jgi:hypothetical protein